MLSSFHKRKEKLDSTFRTREEWWSRVFASPVAHYILCLTADWKFITPNRLTLLSFFLVLTAASLVLSKTQISLFTAAIVLQIAYIFDCMDGQLARYRGQFSKLGAFLDKCLDYIKFPFIIYALILNQLDTSENNLLLTVGFFCLFFICFLPYLKEMAKSDFSISKWRVFSQPNFLSRNLRFFLFEEAQCYLIISLCLIFNRADWALWSLFVTQGALALIHFCRILLILKNKKTS